MAEKKETNVTVTEENEMDLITGLLKAAEYKTEVQPAIEYSQEMDRHCLNLMSDHYLSMKLHSVERKLQLIWQTQAELHFLSLRKK